MELDYHVEIRDSAGNFVQRLEKGDGLFLDFTWTYNRIGGCGRFMLTTKHGFSNLPPYSGNYDVRLNILDLTSGNYNLWYRGIIEQVKSDLRNIETSTITGRGYSSLLEKLTKNGSYSSTEVSAIVKDLLDNVVIPNTDITYDGGDIEATGYTPDTITFNNTSISECFETLSDIVGSYEWGVGSDLKFFFKARTNTTRIYASAGRNILSFDWLIDYSEIINNIKFEGGETGGSKFTRTIGDTSSQTKWGLREKIIQNSSIATNDVADRYGNSILAEKASPRKRGNMTLFRNLADSNYNSPIESNVPIGTVEFKKSNVTFGEKPYGTFTYGGSIQLQINTIKYSLDDNGIIATLGLGGYPPDLALSIGRMGFEMSQLRQRST